MLSQAQRSALVDVIEEKRERRMTMLHNMFNEGPNSLPTDEISALNTLSYPIFYDKSRRRRRWFNSLSLALLALVIVTMVSFTLSMFTPPHLAPHPLLH